MRTLGYLIACATLFVAPISIADHVKVTGIYSDMTFGVESGDVTGIEVFVLYTNHGYMALFQDAEGTPRVPVLVPVIITDQAISFVLPSRSGYSGRFVGKITVKGLVGRFDSGQVGRLGRAEIVLARKPSYWQ